MNLLSAWSGQLWLLPVALGIIGLILLIQYFTKKRGEFLIGAILMFILVLLAIVLVPTTWGT